MKLGVNVDHIATLRQARSGLAPDPVEAAKICLRAGADSVVMHLREDRRHVQDADLFGARRRLTGKLNMEMSIAEGIVRVALKVRPDQVTLVPEKRLEKTTEGGLDLTRQSARIRRVIDTFKKNRIIVSLFIDPDSKQIEAAARFGADAIELHTGDYANQTTAAGILRQFKRIGSAAVSGAKCGLVVHAGHGLDYRNVSKIASLGGIEELNIGYSIVTRALWVGLKQAVVEMKGLIR